MFLFCLYFFFLTKSLPSPFPALLTPIEAADWFTSGWITAAYCKWMIKSSAMRSLVLNSAAQRDLVSRHSSKQAEEFNEFYCLSSSIVLNWWNLPNGGMFEGSPVSVLKCPPWSTFIHFWTAHSSGERPQTNTLCCFSRTNKESARQRREREKKMETKTSVRRTDTQGKCRDIQMQTRHFGK